MDNKEEERSMKWNIGDRVIAPTPYGYAPVHGIIEKFWINEHGVEMASINFGNTNKVDWMMMWHVHVTTKSLKAWEE